MKEQIKLLRLSLAYGGKLHTVLDIGFTHGVFNKVNQEGLKKTLESVISRAEQADKLEKENQELKQQLSATNQLSLL
ncbi:hypothetical protein [Spirosoma sp.]|uniref:hypothetical protein n=1 Tax=Spirosoma sp. TaxID=1899569 RepID=UPI002616B15C|nr:hypothetical protein [Spirosoma sp.]MCX6216583.1 hypothetical protein [Spirosoma sp.]